MKKVISCFALFVLLNACNKEVSESDKPVPAQTETQSKKPSPPSNANPAFAYQDNFTQANRNMSAIYVMDVTGANKTKLYSNYTPQTTNNADFPPGLETVHNSASF